MSTQGRSTLAAADLNDFHNGSQGTRYERLGSTNGYDPINASRSTNENYFRKMKQWGKWIRVGAPWPEIEADDETGNRSSSHAYGAAYGGTGYDFSKIDNWVIPAVDAGLEIIMHLYRSPRWARTGTGGQNEVNTVCNATFGGGVIGNNTKNWTTNEWAGYTVVITDSNQPALIGDTKTIVSNTAQALTLSSAFSPVPETGGTCTFTILGPFESTANPPSSDFESDWEDYCYYTAKRYLAEGVKYFEIWNEPNLNSFWMIGPDAEDYARLLKKAYDKIQLAATELSTEAFVLGMGGTAPCSNPDTWSATRSYSVGNEVSLGSGLTQQRYKCIRAYNVGTDGAKNPATATTYWQTGGNYASFDFVDRVYHYLDQNHAGARPFEHVSHHPYPAANYKEFRITTGTVISSSGQVADTSWNANPQWSSFWRATPLIRRVIEENETEERARSVKIFATEAGVASYSNPALSPEPLTEARQALWVDQMCDIWFGPWASWTGAFCLFKLRDTNTGGPTADPDNFGLYKTTWYSLTSTSDEKPVIAKLRAQSKKKVGMQGLTMGSSEPQTNSQTTPYTTSSPWNIAIPDDVKVHPSSTSLIQEIIESTTTADELRSLRGLDETAVYVVGAGVSNTTLSYEDNYCNVTAADGTHTVTTSGATPNTVSIPIPIRAAVPSGTRKNIVIWKPSTGDEWGITNFGGSYGSFTCDSLYHTNTAWSGLLPKGCGIEGAGTPFLAGLVRQWEILGGKISHALGFRYNSDQESSSPSPTYVYPATSYVLAGVEDMPSGARIQLDPTLTTATMKSWGLDDNAIVICKALQRYGAYIVGRNSSYPSPTIENEFTAGWGQALVDSSLSSVAMAHFRVLDWRFVNESTTGGTAGTEATTIVTSSWTPDVSTMQIATITINDNTTTVSSLSGNGLTWVQLYREAGTAIAQEVWYAYASSAPSTGAVTVNLSGAAAGSVQIVSLVNTSGESCIQANNRSKGTSTTASTSVTTTTAGALVLGVVSTGPSLASVTTEDDHNVGTTTVALNTTGYTNTPTEFFFTSTLLNGALHTELPAGSRTVRCNVYSSSEWIIGAIAIAQ